MKHFWRIQQNNRTPKQVITFVCKNCPRRIDLYRDTVRSILVDRDQRLVHNIREDEHALICRNSRPNHLDGLDYTGRRYVSEEKLGNTRGIS